MEIFTLYPLLNSLEAVKQRPGEVELTLVLHLILRLSSSTMHSFGWLLQLGSTFFVQSIISIVVVVAVFMWLLHILLFVQTNDVNQAFVHSVRSSELRRRLAKFLCHSEKGSNNLLL